jgi:type IV fimbrial biogenesis protein FimT
MNRQYAFTLIELMVVLAVLAILVTVGVPQFQAVIENNNMTANINEFTTSLHFTRSEAVNRGTRVTMCRRNGTARECAAAGAGTGWEAGWLIFVDDDGNNVYDASSTDVLLRVYDPTPSNLQLRGNSNFAERISYLGTGFSSQMGRFILCSHQDAQLSSLDANSNARVIVINATGRPAIKNVSEDLSYLNSLNIANCNLTAVAPPP